MQFVPTITTINRHVQFEWVMPACNQKYIPYNGGYHTRGRINNTWVEYPEPLPLPSSSPRTKAGAPSEELTSLRPRTSLSARDYKRFGNRAFTHTKQRSDTRGVRAGRSFLEMTANGQVLTAIWTRNDGNPQTTFPVKSGAFWYYCVRYGQTPTEVPTKRIFVCVHVNWTSKT